MGQHSTTSAAGETPLACAFGTPWLDHFAPPVGTGQGCPMCDSYRVDPPGKDTPDADQA